MSSTWADDQIGKVFSGKISRWFAKRKFGFVATEDGLEAFLGKHEWSELADPAIDIDVQFTLDRNNKGWIATKCTRFSVLSSASSHQKAKSSKPNGKEYEKAMPGAADTKRYGSLAPKALGDDLFDISKLSVSKDSLQFYRSMIAWGSATSYMSSCKEIAVIYPIEMVDYCRKLADEMFEGFFHCEEAITTAKNNWNVVAHSSFTLGDVLNLLREGRPESKEERNYRVCFEECIKHNPEMHAYAKAAWLLYHAARSRAISPDSQLNSYIITNWFLLHIEKLPFPLAFNFDELSYEDDDALRSAIGSDSEVSLARWIAQMMANQWVAFDQTVQEGIQEVLSSLQGFSATQERTRSTSEMDGKENEAAAAAANTSLSSEEDRNHEIIVAHRRNQRADVCFICMDDHIRPTISMLCCGQPCHIKCMEKWYLSKPNLQGCEKCPQCTQDIPEPQHNTNGGNAGSHDQASGRPSAYTSVAAATMDAAFRRQLNVMASEAVRGEDIIDGQRPHTSRAALHPWLPPQRHSSRLSTSRRSVPVLQSAVSPPPPPYHYYQPYYLASEIYSSDTPYGGYRVAYVGSQQSTRHDSPSNPNRSNGMHAAPPGPAAPAPPGISDVNTPLYYHYATPITGYFQSPPEVQPPYANLSSSRSHSQSARQHPVPPPPAQAQGQPTFGHYPFVPVVSTSGAASSAMALNSTAAYADMLSRSRALAEASLSSMNAVGPTVSTSGLETPAARTAPAATATATAATTATDSANQATLPTLSHTRALRRSGPASNSNVNTVTTTTTIIPRTSRAEELLGPVLRAEPAPPLPSSAGEEEDALLCTHCNSQLRAVECTNFLCGRCCHRSGALNCLRHHHASFTVSGALVLQSSTTNHDEDDADAADVGQRDRDGSEEEEEEDIYDLRRDAATTQLLNMLPSSNTNRDNSGSNADHPPSNTSHVDGLRAESSPAPELTSPSDASSTSPPTADSTMPSRNSLMSTLPLDPSEGMRCVACQALRHPGCANRSCQRCCQSLDLFLRISCSCHR